MAAALAVLEAVESGHRPVRLALKAWGEGARYAGAKDRACVSGLVLDVLRRRRSLAWAMAEETARAGLLAALRLAWDWPIDRIASAAADAHGAGPLSEEEHRRLAAPRPLTGAPEAVAGDYPDWLDPHVARVFGDRRAAHGCALASRAPVDLRANTLKTTRDKVAAALGAFSPAPDARVADALRVAAPAAHERAAPVESAPEFAKGWFEVQDIGSQIAAAAAGAVKGAQVLDYCAGGGGKTLALAAAMENSGQLFAYDSDARRLAETARRAQRAGVRNLQIRSPLRQGALAGLEARMDVVFVDAPCTGTGVWRRHPDAKWRLAPAQLARRMAEQDTVLAAAADFVKPGGLLIYVTCSLLAEENEDRIAAFLAGHGDFRAGEAARRLTPLDDGTDGFFIAPLRRLQDQRPVDPGRRSGTS